ncbi:ERI1 exoribonuclease 2-like [Lytechinus variegatus]|uniref:ERI1 exoribonuclease 2-like n=1 Tax=Lytechinus variegatus TaxID=7654 RepID=UPI001BB182CD|nr:ERI1 exoribonuclease 2-like [Lytechinus variegatus]
MKSTKQLAKELGLLRKRVSSSKANATKSKGAQKSRTCQTFTYLIVIDFESTCWKDKKNTNQEIIEFPAVLLNATNGQLESEFQQYVMPDEHPILSDFCTEFTGISQEQVENGVPLFICLNKFTSWLKRIESEKNVAYNRSTDDTKKLCTFVTWSDWDLGVCLHYECQRKQLYKPSTLNHWIDARAVYRNFYQRKPKGLNGALQEVGIEFSGRQHSGLDDAKNTARLVWRMIQDGCHFKITKTIQSGTLKAIPRALPQPGSAQQQTKDSSAPSTSMTTTALQPQPSLKSSSSAAVNTTHQTRTKTTDSSHTGASSTSSSLPKTETEQPFGKVNKSKRKSNGRLSIEITKKSCLASEVKGQKSQGIPFQIYEDGKIGDDKDEFGSTCKTVVSKLHNKQAEPKLHSLNGDVRNVKFTKGETPTHRTSGSTGEFKTPPVCALPFHKQNSIKKYGKLGEKTSPGVQFKTPVSTKTPATDDMKTPSGGSFKPGVCMAKVTPPMCKCGRRSKRRVAARPGPNQGRAFYSCPGLRRGSGGGLKDTTNSKMGCGFFSWESMVLNDLRSPNAVGSPGSFTTPGSALKTPSPLAMGSIQKAISFKTGQNPGMPRRGSITPIGVGYSNSWR